MPNPSPLAAPLPWNLVSQGYNDYSRVFMEMFSEAALERLIIDPSHVVIDVACGPGTATLQIAPRVARVEAVDFSEGMLDQLRANLNKAALGNISVQRGDGQELPFEDMSFDIGLSFFGLMFFPERPRGFAELFRVLRPGGQVAVSSWAPAERSSAMKMVMGALSAADPARSGANHDPTTLENPQVFEREMRKAGFTDVRIVEVERGMDVEEGGAFWDDMSRGCAPVALMKEHLGTAEWDRQNAIARKYLQDNIKKKTHLSSVSFLGLGRRP